MSDEAFAIAVNKAGGFLDEIERLETIKSDHTLVLAALISRRARWEQRGSNPFGELCMGGLCHLLNVDEFGCPILTESARDALLELEEAA